jgi:hypothetical protein
MSEDTFNGILVGLIFGAAFAAPVFYWLGTIAK